MRRTARRKVFPPALIALTLCSVLPAAQAADDAYGISDLGFRIFRAAPGGGALAKDSLSLDVVWVLLCGFMVMFMKVGFALLETGLCRARNASHTMAMNFMIYPLACIAFWSYGFAIGWGHLTNGSLAGGFFLQNLLPGDGAVLAFFFLMLAFLDVTATIPTGAMAERWAWKNFCLYGLWVALPFGLFAKWVWGGGWLAEAGRNWGLGHGVLDFAGSGVVHGLGGMIALAGVLALRSRLGKYSANGRPQPFLGHHVPMVTLGTLILAFGWFGFNAGAALGGTNLRISLVAVNTMLASSAGALAAMCYLMSKRMKPDVTICCNGLLAGLVAITAPCAFVSPWAAALIGAVAGVLVVSSIFFWEVHGVDDPAGAISVHGINGLWGLLAVGLFANGRYGAGWNGMDGPVKGLFYGDAGQLGAQMLGSAVLVFGIFPFGYFWFKLSDKITPLRVPAAVELQGLDIPEVGAPAYPDFMLKSNP